MSDLLSLRRVLWRDGDVISESHFYALERWTEQLVGLTNQQSGTFGMVRNALLQPGYNNLSNLNFKQIEGSHYRVDVEQMQAVNMFGHVIKIDGLRSIDFHFKPVQRSADGNYFLYLAPAPAGQDANQPTGSEVITGTTVYEAPYELSVANDSNTGVPVCRFRIEENQVRIDSSFIPFGIFIDSTPMSVVAQEGVLEKFAQWNALLIRYLDTLKPIPEMMVIWNATGELLRAASLAAPMLEERHTPTLHFFRALQQLFNAIRTEMKLVYLGWNQETLRQRATEIMNLLEQPLVTMVGQQCDLSVSFGLADRMMDASIKILSYMPAGPVTEKTLSIARAELMKEAAGNKITITLAEEALFAKGKSRLTIHLRDFSKADPLGGNTRVGLGSVIFAQLLDLKGHLKRVPGESFTYNLECPPEVVSRDKALQITLYLPPPLGEGVIDLKSHITIMVKD
jgi:hypothetical protein